MEFTNDKPIEDGNDDLLDRSRFVKLVADALSGSHGRESIVVGLYGDWGSGKTSIVNLTLKHIREQESASGEDNPIVFTYSPWACSAGDQLQYQFFVQLAAALSRGAKVKKAGKRLAKLVADYGDAIALAGAPAATAAAIAKPVFRLMAADAGIAGLRGKIDKKLKKETKRVIVVIDDIDRLSSSQIVSVFQLVSAVANFQNTVFVLPFDYKVVTDALNGVQGAGAIGAEYLSKIIQIPLVVPKAKPNQLRSMVEHLIAEHVRVVDEEDASFVRQAISEVALHCIRTARDVKRLANAFAFSVYSFGEELNYGDLLVLSTLQAFDPALYRFIASHRALLCEHELFPNDSARYLKQFNSELDACFGNESSELRMWREDVLKSLFIKVRSSGQSYSSNYDRKHRRLSCVDYFDAYFSYSNNDIVVEYGEISRLAEDPAHADDVVDRAVEEGRYLPLLDEIISRVDEMKPEARRDLVSLLFSCFGKPSETTSNALFSMSSDYATEHAITQVLGTLDRGDCDGVVCQAVESADLDNLIGMASFINGRELAHGRLAANESNKDRQFISEACLDGIEQRILARLQLFAENRDGLLSHGSDLHMLMYLWSQFDASGYDAFWRSVLDADTTNYAYVPICFAQQWSSSDGSFGWTFNRNGIRGIVDEAALRETLVSLVEQGGLKERLSVLDRCKVVAYIAKPDGSFAKDDALSYAEAKSLLEQWEK